jgi:hypothetical protein
MAFASVWITIASMLATLDIKKARDDSGNEIEPSYEYSPDSGVHFVSFAQFLRRPLIGSNYRTPLPFECSITPRSRHAVEVIQATFGCA